MCLEKCKRLNLKDFEDEHIYDIVNRAKDIDLSTLNYKDGLQTYYVDEEKYHEAFEFLKENVEEKVFTLEDVKNGYLYTSILDTLS